MRAAKQALDQFPLTGLFVNSQGDVDARSLVVLIRLCILGEQITIAKSTTTNIMVYGADGAGVTVMGMCERTQKRLVDVSAYVMIKIARFQIRRVVIDGISGLLCACASTCDPITAKLPTLAAQFSAQVKIKMNNTAYHKRLKVEVKGRSAKASS